MPNADTTDDATDDATDVPTIEAGHVLRAGSTGKLYTVADVDADADALYFEGLPDPLSIETVREDISAGHITLFTPVTADE